MLDDTQIAHFQDQGYLVVEDLLDAETLEAVKAEYAARMDELYVDWHARGMVAAPPTGLDFWGKLDQCYQGGFDWYQPFDISLPHGGITHDTPMHFGPAVFDMVTSPRILNMVEQLIGPEISSNPIQHVRIKPPQRALAKDEIRAHVTQTDWHQDMGVTLPEADETTFVTVWLAITDATIENGCLQVAPGKRDETLPHCNKTQVAIADQFLPKDNAVPTPVRAGGAVIFHPLTPHSSLANKTDGYRWSFDLRYHVTGEPSGRSQFPEFVARSRANPGSELRDWKGWRTLWEDARARLAVSPHIDQHRWDNSGQYCA